MRTTAWACAICHLFENLLPAASYSRRVSDLKVPNSDQRRALRYISRRATANSLFTTRMTTYVNLLERTRNCGYKHSLACTTWRKLLESCGIYLEIVTRHELSWVDERDLSHMVSWLSAVWVRTICDVLVCFITDCDAVPWCLSEECGAPFSAGCVPKYRGHADVTTVVTDPQTWWA